MIFQIDALQSMDYDYYRYKSLIWIEIISFRLIPILAGLWFLTSFGFDAKILLVLICTGWIAVYRRTMYDWLPSTYGRLDKDKSK